MVDNDNGNENDEQNRRGHALADIGKVIERSATNVEEFQHHSSSSASELDKRQTDNVTSTLGQDVTQDPSQDSTQGPTQDQEIKREKKVDEYGRAYATGKRKNAIARVWIKPGTGRIIVNGRNIQTYFARAVLRMIIAQPLTTSERETQYDIMCFVKGGGLSGQAGAVRHGIAKALSCFEPELHRLLRQNGYITRDSRVVERKKYGRPKARRRFQFSKR